MHILLESDAVYSVAKQIKSKINLEAKCWGRNVDWP